MPIIKSAIKRAKQTTKRRERNVGIKQDIKSATKAFIAKPTVATLAAAQSELDTAVKKGLLKKNTVARRKSGLHAIAKSAGVKLTAKTAKKPTAKLVTKTTTEKSPAKKPATIKKPVTKKPAVKKTPVKKPATKKATK
jgi:ribosomal protein S20